MRGAAPVATLAMLACHGPAIVRPDVGATEAPTAPPGAPSPAPSAPAGPAPPGADAAAPAGAPVDPDGWPELYALVERWDRARRAGDLATLAATSAPDLRAWGAPVDLAALPPALRGAPALGAEGRQGHATEGGDEGARRVQFSGASGVRWVDLRRTPEGWRVAAWDDEASWRTRARSATAAPLAEGPSCWRLALRFDAVGSGMAWDEVVSEATLRLERAGGTIVGSYTYSGGFSHLVTEQVVLDGDERRDGSLHLSLGPPRFAEAEEPARQRVDERWSLRLLAGGVDTHEQLVWLDGEAPFPGEPLPRVPCP